MDCRLYQSVHPQQVVVVDILAEHLHRAVGLEKGYRRMAYAVEHELPYVLAGDVNGDRTVNINDVTAIQCYLAEIDSLSDEALLAADTDGDGELAIADASRLQMYLAEYDVKLGRQL